MPYRYRFNLTFAILTSLASLLLLTWLLLSIISFKTAEKDLLELKTSYAGTLLTTLLAAFPAETGRHDLAAQQLDHMLATVAKEKDFAGFLLVDQSGRTLTARDDRRGNDARLLAVIYSGMESSTIAEKGQLLLSYAPLRIGGKVVGAARLALSLGEEHARLARSRTLFLGYFILDFILLLGLGAFMLRRIVVSPLERMLAATKRIISGNYSHPLHVHGREEIAGLAESFNVMQETLKKRSEEVETHVRSLEEANRALQEARQESIRSEKMASVGLLAAGMAHEIGTPLAAIIGYNGVLADELAGDEEKSDYIRRIGQEAARIDRLVRDMLDYARPGKAREELLDVSELLDDLFGMLERQGVFKKVVTRLEVEPGIPQLYLDRHQLMQVLVNLVINARDAMPEGGELTARAASSADEVIIEIADTGAGILPENLEKIFDPFFTTKEPGSGTGLGLAISARLVESFGGRLYVRSQVGEGTTFTVWLPVNRQG
jgi:signal transduction histidine kinase